MVRGEARGVGPALLRGALCGASLGYGLAVRLRNLAYTRGWLRVTRAGAAVVSVGNLTVGGTGKTPCVEYVAGWYARHDARAAVLSRGYGSTGGLNDEGQVLYENLPELPAPLQGVDRVELARIAVEELEAEVLVLDDGFQHRRLGRDVDVVLIDATNPWGHGWLLPRGLLREPPSALGRADAVVLTRCDQADPDALADLRRRVARLAPAAVRAEAVHRPEGLVNGDQREDLGLLRGRPVIAFCGLGNPEGFWRTLHALGVRPGETRGYPDHHAYTAADVAGLSAWAARQPADAVVVTTQKDLVKLRVGGLAGRPLWALRVRMEFTAGQAEFDALLGRVLPR